MEAPSLLVCIALASVALLVQPAAAQFSYPARVIQGDSCPPDEQREATRSDINNDLDTLLQDFIAPPLIPCGGLGWKRIAYVNTTETTYCPPPWVRIANNLCHHSSGASFESVTFNTGIIPYDQVCGRVIAYQKGSTDAFNVFINRTIDNAYVDGVSVTHGFPRQHIWSFAAGNAEITVLDSSSLCPCSLNSTSGPNVPTFVENNFFCDTGTITNSGQFTSYLDDPLWDGQGCGPSSNCCSFNSPPWFNVRLPNATTDGIEVRLGIDYASRSTEDILLELLVIYIR